MNSPRRAFFPSPGLTFFLLLVTPCAPTWAQATFAPSPQTTYVYFQRTSAHLKFSTPEVFQEVMNEIHKYLSANDVVALTEDNGLSSGSDLPFSAVQEMARDAGAAYILYVTVDRPMSKWLKVRVQCYDTSGHELWQEEASAGGGLSSRNAAHDALQRLLEELNRRLGQPGLPQGVSRQNLAPTASGPEQKSAPTGSTSQDRPAGPASDTQPAPSGGL